MPTSHVTKVPSGVHSISRASRIRPFALIHQNNAEFSVPGRSHQSSLRWSARG
jgi:hypothetical protein